MSAAIATRRATHDDLMRAEGKAELIRGEVVSYMPCGFRHGILAGRIFRRLGDYADAHGGVVLGDSVGYAVENLSTDRESFSPDASYYTGPPPADPMKFVPGPPDFAVEIRSACDYGPSAENAMAEKRAEYFEAGTLVVWDVDPEERVIHSYRHDDETPLVFAIGDEATAEPAVPGWKLSVDWLMAD